MLRACVGPLASNAGVRLLSRTRFHDVRGSIEELNLDFPSTRSLVVVSHKYVIRGVHFQEPATAPLTKAITVLDGSIEEFVFDLRSEELFSNRLEKYRLDDESPALVIPSWCAHGYAVVSDRAVVQYHFDAPRVPEAERFMRWDSLPIIWPFKEPILSEKDATAPGASEVLARRRALTSM